MASSYTVKFFDVDDFHTIVDLMGWEDVILRNDLQLRVCKRTLKDMLFWLNSMPYIKFVIINPPVL